MPGQSEGCDGKLSKCSIWVDMVHLGHAFDQVNKFWKFSFQNNFRKKSFLQKTCWATIMSRGDKTHIFNVQWPKFTSLQVFNAFSRSHNTFLSEFTKISSRADHMWPGHLIVPGWQNVSPGRMKLLFWAKRVLKQFWFVPYFPWMLSKTLLAQYGQIFTQKYILPSKRLIFAKCPGMTKLEKYT